MEKLDFNELEQVQGGISREKYCDQLWDLQHYNWDSWSGSERSSFAYAWEAHCVWPYA